MKPIIFFRGQMKPQPPALTYNRKPLEHYDAQCYGGAWTLYFAPSTATPKSQAGWADVLAREGLTLVRWDNTPDGSVEVIARQLE